MKVIISIGIVSVFIFCSCFPKRQEFNINEKRLISYQEFKKVENPDYPPLSIMNIAVNLDSVQTFSHLDSYIKDICNGKFPNAKYDDCWDILPFIYNTEDFTFKPNIKSECNIQIPAFGFRCKENCMVDFIHVNHFDIHAMRNETYKLENFPTTDTFKYCSLNELSVIIDQLNKRNFKKFFDKSELINDLGKRDSLVNYYQMLTEAFQIRVTLDTTLTFRKLEPLVSVIISSHLKNLNDFTEKYMNKSIEQLSTSDVKIIFKNLGLRLLIHRPFENIKYIAPVVIDSVANE